jgi:hypothetical protein
MMIIVVQGLSPMHVVGRIAIGAAVYCIGLLVFRGIDGADMKIIRNLLGVPVKE